MKQLTKVYTLILGMLAVFAMIQNEISSPLLYHTLRGNTDYAASNVYVASDIYIPHSLDTDSQRRLSNSINLGGGACQWQPPTYEVPEDVEFQKTFVAGFPSGDKRMAYLQMEALAGFPAKDEWDFAYDGMSNHPFIKGNYPHHEGIWGWGTVADQTILMVPNIRRSMLEYHDILWDLGYATTYEIATLMSDNLYGQRPSFDEFYEWRDTRVLDEIFWYGWHIDFWMEGGLLRDIFTHKLTTQEHWDDLLLKPFYTRSALAYDKYVSEGTVVEPTYDSHCVKREISNGCEPMAIISADKLRDYAEGPAETSAIAMALMTDPRIAQYVIAEEAWDCIWEELIKNKKGPKTMADRPGYEGLYDEYNFSSEMLLGMIDELNRLITKYSGRSWDRKLTAIRLVEILVEHRDSVEAELQEINTGVRLLTSKDFLGPQERSERRKLKSIHHTDGDLERKILQRYLNALEQKRFENKRRQMNLPESTWDSKAKSSETMSDEDFIKVLSGALAQIRSLEASGGMDKEKASDLTLRVHAVALEANVVLVKDAE